MGKLADALRGVALPQQKKVQMLNLDKAFSALEAQVKILKAERQKLEAQVNPLKREVERLKQQIQRMKDKSVRSIADIARSLNG